MATSIHERVQNREEEIPASAGFMGNTKFLSEKQAPVVEEPQALIGFGGKKFTGVQYITFNLLNTSAGWVSIYLCQNTERYSYVFLPIQPT